MSKQLEKLPISVYIVCRNGGELLKKAMDSVWFCDDKIFVNDRSTDDSVDTAKRHGFDVYQWLGTNSMSERRNYAVGYKGDEEYTPEWVGHPQMSNNVPKIKNEWVIQLDADEIIMPTTLVMGEDGKPLSTYDLFKEFIHVMSGGGRSKIFKHIRKKHIKNMGAAHMILHNIYQEDGFEVKFPTGGKMLVEGRKHLQTTVPIPRIYHAKSVHWKLAVQNMDYLEDGKKWRMEFPVVLEHYGYGDAAHHFNKQFARMSQLEERVRSDPDDLHSVMYLVCGLAVLMEGGPNVPDFERMQALVQVAIWDFLDNDEIKTTRWLQVTMQRIMRHFWGACSQNGRIGVFKTYLDTVSEYMDYIPDVHWWELEIAKMSSNPFYVLERGDKFLESLKTYRKMQGQSIELMSLTKEPEIRQMLSQVSKDIATQLVRSDKPEVREQAIKYIELSDEYIAKPKAVVKKKKQKRTTPKKKGNLNKKKARRKK